MLQRPTSRLAGDEPGSHDSSKLLARKRHNLTLKGREHLAIEGVVNVESFDRKEVLLETEQGVMLVRGEDLHIKELSLEGTGLVVTGFVHSIEYHGEKLSKQSKGFLGRLFK